MGLNRSNDGRRKCISFGLAEYGKSVRSVSIWKVEGSKNNRTGNEP